MLELQSPSQEAVSSARKRSLQCVTKPSLMTKLIVIFETIDPFYNEYIRHLSSMFIISAVKYSKANQQTRSTLQADLDRKKQTVL